MLDVDLVTDDDAWAVDNAGRVHRWNGSLWRLDPERITSESRTGSWSLDMASAQRGWAAGGYWASQGLVKRWDGVSWATVPSPGTGVLADIDMRAPNNGWAVGARGDIIHWNGSEWAEIASPTEEELRSVDTVSEDDGWIVGDGGVILRWDGDAWVDQPRVVSAALQSVFMSGAAEGWAVGDEGTILHWDGRSWARVPSPTSFLLRSITMAAPDLGWAVGSGAVLLEWDGQAWRRVYGAREMARPVSALSAAVRDEPFVLGLLGDRIDVRIDP
jgi:photosystem II stability/assembly factor-like uncharacterized protein